MIGVNFSLLLSRPLPVTYPWHRTLHDQRARVLPTDLDVIQRPTRSIVFIRAQQRRRHIRRERHIKAVERLRQSSSRRFDVRLFARPAPEESRHALRLVQRVESLNFETRKEAPRDVLTGEVSANAFDVNSQFAVFSNGKQRDAVRVRHVEA